MVHLWVNPQRRPEGWKEGACSPQKAPLSAGPQQAHRPRSSAPIRPNSRESAESPSAAPESVCPGTPPGYASQTDGDLPLPCFTSRHVGWQGKSWCSELCIRNLCFWGGTSGHHSWHLRVLGPWGLMSPFCRVSGKRHTELGRSDM